MKYSLDIFIVCDNHGVRNAVKNLIPKITDEGIFQDGYIGIKECVGKENEVIDLHVGHNMLEAMSRYEDTHLASAVNRFNSFKGLNGLWSDCIDGYVRIHECGNYPTDGIFTPCNNILMEYKK